jgi:hypothetical protein
MAAVNPAPSPDAVEQDLIEAEREIRTAIDRAGLRDDPYAAVLLAAASFLSLLRGARAEYRSEIANAVTEVRQPFSPADLDQLYRAASEGAWRASTDIAWVHYYKHLAITTAAAVVLMIAAFGAGFWWHGSQQLVAGVSAGQQECHEQPNGGTLCYIPMWSKLPPR